MGFLSQMTTWHLQDPPSAEEILRNQQICQHWQGNRNPFVDHPELATALHYEPFSLPEIGERTIYEACEKLPTLPNSCDTLVGVGDI